MKGLLAQIGFFVSYGLVLLISLLPLQVHYLLARVFVTGPLRLMGYRRSVILTNLARSFPEKSYGEIHQIAKDFYRHMGDLVAETLWLFTATKKQQLRHFVFPDSPFLEEAYQQGRTVLFILGHFGNWEFTQNGGASPTGKYGSYPLENVCIAYQKQSSPVMDKIMLSLRTRNKTGFHVIEKQHFVRYALSHRNQPSMYCLIADQCPLPGAKYTAHFLNQPTLMVDGPETLARKLNCMVVYACLQPQKRGTYLVKIEPICTTPSECPDGAITQRFATLLEEDIRQNPAQWLWSHKRWKRRPKM